MNSSFLLLSLASLLVAAFAIPLERVKRGGYGRPSGYGAPSGDNYAFGDQGGFDGGFNNGGFNNGGFNNGGFNNGGWNRVKRGGYGRPYGYGNGGFDNQGGFDGGFNFNNGGFKEFPNNGGFQNGGFQNGGGFNDGFNECDNQLGPSALLTMNFSVFLLLVSSLLIAAFAIPQERFKRGGYGRPSGYGAASYGNGGFDNQGGLDGGFNQYPDNSFSNGGYQNGGYNRVKRGGYGAPSYGGPSYGNGGFDQGFNGVNFNQFPSNGGYQNGGFNSGPKRCTSRRATMSAEDPIRKDSNAAELTVSGAECLVVRAWEAEHSAGTVEILPPLRDECDNQLGPSALLTMNFSVFLLLVSSLLIAAFAIPQERFKRGGYGRPSGYGASSYGNGGFDNQGGLDGDFNQYPDSNLNNGGIQNGGFNRVKRGGFQNGAFNIIKSDGFQNGGFYRVKSCGIQIGGFYILKSCGFQNGAFNRVKSDGIQNGLFIRVARGGYGAPSYGSGGYEALYVEACNEVCGRSHQERFECCRAHGFWRGMSRGACMGGRAFCRHSGDSSSSEGW
ncbi:hypothetical protein PRIPAC_89930 [Pristionchus pacificus]|uniref:Uncharacterized protein n=1 Tax=Pristionchus pacificus TaxID=54126 RepID=A0A2A6B9G7_PRIPA|nr:hypothetical protein PRIPAC_89930 [Pristionchus pacificus]|eukprot:PDM62525.1 hypothetical protein PRIPAC_51967 [Pristionchus pacificus]